MNKSFLSRSLLARFDREVKVLTELDHPQIPKLFDSGDSGELRWIAMEYINGLPITDYSDNHLLDVFSRLKLLVSLAQVMAYAHEHDIVHRDIKASNVLVDQEGRVHLLDFGVAKTLGARCSTEGLTLEALAPMTFECAAPEQFRIGAPITSRTDVYQFGILAYRLLTGASPYSAKPDDLLDWGNVVNSQAPARLKKMIACKKCDGEDGRIRRRIVNGLDEIFWKALAKKPADRYRSMNILRNDLTSLLAKAESNSFVVPWHRRITQMLGAKFIS